MGLLKMASFVATSRELGWFFIVSSLVTPAINFVFAYGYFKLARWAFASTPPLLVISHRALWTNKIRYG